MPDTVTIPKNVVESATAYFWLEEEGIFVIFNKSKALHDLHDAQENVEISEKVSNGIPRPLLIDITHIKSMDRHAREDYAKAGALNKVKAVALVTRSSVSRMVGNFFIGFNRPQVPTKLFGDHKSAKKWLLQYIGT